MKTQADRIECAQCRQMVKVQTARKSAPIPMRDTPIYAEMMAERDIQARINQTHARPEVRDALKAGRTRPADKYTLTRKPLLKNGKRS